MVNVLIGYLEQEHAPVEVTYAALVYTGTGSGAHRRDHRE